MIGLFCVCHSDSFCVFCTANEYLLDSLLVQLYSHLSVKIPVSLFLAQISAFLVLQGQRSPQHEDLQCGVEVTPPILNSG